MLNSRVEQANQPVNPPDFERFLISPGSRFALAAVQVVASRPGKIGNPLLIQGPRGSGKTPLLHHLHRELRKHHPASRIFPLPAEAFFDTKGGLIKEWKQAVINAPPAQAWAVLIDGIQDLKNRQGAMEFLFRFMSCCVQAGGQIVLTCASDEPTIKGLADRLRLNFINPLCVNLGENAGGNLFFGQ